MRWCTEAWQPLCAAAVLCLAASLSSFAPGADATHLRSTPFCLPNPGATIPHCEIHPGAILPILTKYNARPKSMFQVVQLARSATMALCDGWPTEAACPSQLCTWFNSTGTCRFRNDDPLGTIKLLSPYCWGSKLWTVLTCYPRQTPDECSAAPGGACEYASLPGSSLCLPKWLLTSGMDGPAIIAYLVALNPLPNPFNQDEYNPDLFGCCAAYLTVQLNQRPGCVSATTKAACQSGNHKRFCAWAGGACQPALQTMYLPLGGPLAVVQKRCNKLRLGDPQQGPATCARRGNITLPSLQSMADLATSALRSAPAPPSPCPAKFWDAVAWLAKEI